MLVFTDLNIRFITYGSMGQPLRNLERPMAMNIKKHGEMNRSPPLPHSSRYGIGSTFGWGAFGEACSVPIQFLHCIRRTNTRPKSYASASNLPLHICISSDVLFSLSLYQHDSICLEERCCHETLLSFVASLGWSNIMLLKLQRSQYLPDSLGQIL